MLADECAAHNDAHVIDVSIRGSQQRPMVEIFIDAEAGVTSDMCSVISREVSASLDARSLIRGSYQLVVSSPGIERSLKFPWQYRKHVGKTFRLRTKTGSGDEKHTGKLVAISNDTAVFEIGKEKESISVPFDAIAEAIVQAPW